MRGKAACLALFALAVAAQDEDRGAGGLGVTPDSRRVKLWEGGRVRYYNNHPNATLRAAVYEAIRHWELRTCIRFDECDKLAGCGQGGPWVNFVDSDVATCSSPVGVRHPRGENTIRLSSKRPICALAAVHEIGHTMGLNHEMTRRDRDDHVEVVLGDVVDSRRRRNFVRVGSQGRDIGEYDYKSMMHYKEDKFAKDGTVTIKAREAIGRRFRISDGDAATIDFLYNSCSKKYKAPRLIASVDSGAVHMIPVNAPFSVEINAQYTKGSSMTVAYPAVPGVTAPASRVSFSKRAGTSLGDTGYTRLVFTPVRDDAGKTFELGARITAADGLSSSLRVKVAVADAATVCFGKAGTDPNVCSGHGTCTDSVSAPCRCDEGYSGVQCESGRPVEVPVPAPAPMCSSHTCSAGFRARRSAAGLTCASAGCTDARCCESTCAAFSCPVGSLKARPGSRVCGATPRSCTAAKCCNAPAPPPKATPPTTGPSEEGGRWYVSWSTGSCKADGKHKSWQKTHASKAACCKAHLSWRGAKCLK